MATIFISKRWVIGVETSTDYNYSKRVGFNPEAELVLKKKGERKGGWRVAIVVVVASCRCCCCYIMKGIPSQL